MSYTHTAVSVFTNADNTASVRIAKTVNDSGHPAFVWAFGDGVRVTLFHPTLGRALPINRLAAQFAGEETLAPLDGFITTNI